MISFRSKMKTLCAVLLLFVCSPATASQYLSVTCIPGGDLIPNVYSYTSIQKECNKKNNAIYTYKLYKNDGTSVTVVSASEFSDRLTAVSVSHYETVVISCPHEKAKNVSMPLVNAMAVLYKMCAVCIKNDCSGYLRAGAMIHELSLYEFFLGNNKTDTIYVVDLQHLNNKNQAAYALGVIKSRKAAGIDKESSTVELPAVKEMNGVTNVLAEYTPTGCYVLFSFTIILLIVFICVVGYVYYLLRRRGRLPPVPPVPAQAPYAELERSTQIYQAIGPRVSQSGSTYDDCTLRPATPFNRPSYLDPQQRLSTSRRALSTLNPPAPPPPPPPLPGHHRNLSLDILDMRPPLPPNNATGRRAENSPAACLPSAPSQPTIPPRYPSLPRAFVPDQRQRLVSCSPSNIYIQEVLSESSPEDETQIDYCAMSSPLNCEYR